MNANYFINKLKDSKGLSEVESRELAKKLVGNEFTSSQVGAILTALAIKGENCDEIVGFSKGLRENIINVNFKNEAMIDTCGTGGDGLNSFNVSTTVAFIAAAAGIKVAKHGNKALSSNCGSADVLEELGIDINLSESDVSNALETIGMAFIFAPNYNLAMKNVAKERKEIAIRTIFNLVGPILNPATLTGQLIGVSNKRNQKNICYALKDLGMKRALVVHGDEGLDEISICSETNIFELNDGNIFSYKIKPEDFNIERVSIDELRGGDKKINAEIILNILDGEIGAKRDMVLINAAGALYVGGKVESLMEGIKLAREIIDNGLAMKKLNELRDFKGGEFYDNRRNM